MNEMDRRVDVQGETGIGTQVKVLIPVDFGDISHTLSATPPSSEVDPTPVVAVVSNHESSPTPSHIPHILLVDDNNVHLVLLERCMKRLNFPYRTASNGAEAVETYKGAEAGFDFVFMDVSMPIMDGFEATSAIRDFERDSGRAATQIIAMTASTSERSREQVIKRGMDLYLTKPVQMKKVHSLICGDEKRVAAAG